MREHPLDPPPSTVAPRLPTVLRLFRLRFRRCGAIIAMPSSTLYSINGSASYARSPINLRRRPRTRRDARVSRTKFTSYGPAHETWKARPAPVASATAMTLLPSPGSPIRHREPLLRDHEGRGDVALGRVDLASFLRVPSKHLQDAWGSPFRPIPENGGGRSYEGYAWAGPPTARRCQLQRRPFRTERGSWRGRPLPSVVGAVGEGEAHESSIAGRRDIQTS